MTEKLKKVFLGRTENEVNFRLLLVFAITNIIFGLVNFDFKVPDNTPILEGVWNGACISLQSPIYWFVITLESFGKYYILLPINKNDKRKCRKLSIPVFGFFYSIYLNKSPKKKKP